MIIQIRGTSGSGKTTIMKQAMECLSIEWDQPWEAVFQTGRKQPLYYFLGKMVVLGHYNSACGGCDTIGSAAAVYALTQGLVEAGPGRIILQEGLLLSEDTKWSSQLDDLRVLYLMTPVEKCLEQIRGRRAEAGNDKPLNEANTRNRVAVIERSRIKLIEAGKTCRRASTTQATGIILDWIRLHANQESENGSGTKLDQRQDGW